MSLLLLRLPVDEQSSGGSGSNDLVSGLYQYVRQGDGHGALLGYAFLCFPLTSLPCCFTALICGFGIAAGSVFGSLAMLSLCSGESEASSVEQD